MVSPRRTWWHNCPPGGLPVWAWVRPDRSDQRPVSASAYWGAFRYSIEALDDVGVVLAVESSTTNPPIRVELDSPGWVDFGRSTFPASLGVAVMAVVDGARLHQVEAAVTAVLPSTLPGASAHHRRLIALIHRLVGEPPESTRAAVAAIEHGEQPFEDLSGRPVPPPPRAGLALDGAAYASLRRSRGLSRRIAAATATALVPDHPVTDDHLEVLEAGGRPRPWRLGSRLDTVYRADGHTCLEPAVVTPCGPPGLYAVEFPSYWVGPVWVAFHGAEPGADPAAAASLVWRPWRKDLCVRSGTVVMFRRSGPDQSDLLIRLQPGWTALAGIGFYEPAVDVNEGWTVDEGQGVTSLFTDLYSTYLTAFGLTHDQLMRLIEASSA